MHPGKEFCLVHYKEQDNYAYGLDAELQNKMAAKLDKGKEAQARQWLETLCGEAFSESSLQDALKSGGLSTCLQFSADLLRFMQEFACAKLSTRSRPMW